jgi:hypothetical protein
MLCHGSRAVADAGGTVPAEIGKDNSILRQCLRSRLPEIAVDWKRMKQ